jgi:hypothetical protein
VAFLAAIGFVFWALGNYLHVALFDSGVITYAPVPNGTDWTLIWHEAVQLAIWVILAAMWMWIALVVLRWGTRGARGFPTAPPSSGSKTTPQRSTEWQMTDQRHRSSNWSRRNRLLSGQLNPARGTSLPSSPSLRATRQPPTTLSSPNRLQSEPRAPGQGAENQPKPPQQAMTAHGVGSRHLLLGSQRNAPQADLPTAPYRHLYG